ncbi:MAG: hypothetical protein QOE82_1696 [Thermoanaerobaculia bacterium]|jgi:hypothetical protein|nr:hypothetical protein [Thermoanaerobaculia bacterium]
MLLDPPSASRTPLEEGVITRIEDFGLGFVESRKSGERYAFRFDKIDGYHGETLRELGLRAGSAVLIEVVGPHVKLVRKY